MRPAPAPADPAADTSPSDPAAARRHPVPPTLLTSLSALDLTSADGRAGLQSFLAEIERRAPGALLQQASAIQLRRLGCATLADYRDRGQGGPRGRG